eukprot:3435254-Alexandrium_andersonii.AAC.1
MAAQGAEPTQMDVSSTEDEEMQGRKAAAASAMAGRAAATPSKALEALRASRRDAVNPLQRGAAEAPPARA